MAFGLGCIAGGLVIHSRTYIDLSNPSPLTGRIERVCIYAWGFSSASVGAKIKVFRDDGTNYQIIGDRSITLYPQFHVYEISGIDVQAGDFIGIYTPASTGPHYDTIRLSSGSATYKTSDVTTTTLKSTWAASPLTPCMQGFFSYYIKTTGNDSLSGLSWAQAWKTVNKAATTVADGSMVHIGFGTYNAEPAGNKIAPQNIGASGISYLPETATTGGGTGTVSIEKNA